MSNEPSDPDGVESWRTAERKRLIAERLAIPAATRRKYAEGIAAGLGSLFSDGEIAGHVCSVYWPFRGEPDLRGWMKKWHHSGGISALPCVVERRSPLIFRVWEPGARMERGIWNIPVPLHGSEVIPAIVIAPLVGFDRDGYRLGYGGGYFDRTLAALPSKARVIGVGFSRCEITTIYPQDFDIPMDVIVTEKGVVHSG
jgi:5-formyltetrahydrofolate cyclo-ligase